MAENLVNSVRKALDIMDKLVFEDEEGKGIGLFDLSRKLDIKPNTLHNLLKTMISCGYVAQNAESKYLAGPKCANIGMLNRLSPKNDALEKIEDLLQEVSGKIDESVIFAVLSDGERRVLLRVLHDSPIKVDFETLENDHIYKKDTGRILTAFADAFSLQRVLDRWGLPGDKWDGIEDREGLEAALSAIQAQGSSQSYPEGGAIVSMAVPVLDKNGALLGSLGSYAPAFRCSQDKQELMLAEMKKAAEAVSRLISP